jgi:hypothetical protein
MPFLLCPGVPRGGLARQRAHLRAPPLPRREPGPERPRHPAERHARHLPARPGPRAAHRPDQGRAAEPAEWRAGAAARLERAGVYFNYIYLHFNYIQRLDSISRVWHIIYLEFLCN